MNRRDFLAVSGAAALSGPLAGFARADGTAGAARAAAARCAAPCAVPADYSLRIAPLKLELAPGKAVHTVAYNGVVPGPVIRLKQGAPVTVDVVNDSGDDEFVHWHGLTIPADVDGAKDEGSPPIPAHGRRSYTFTPNPAGTRWYHSHTFAGKNFNRSTYTGQFGFLLIDAPDEPGRFDQEVFIALHDWDGFVTGGDDGFEMVGYRYSSINGRLLGADDPIRVREGERVLVRVLNASASEAHSLSLPGHRFRVQALDGNSVPTPAAVETLTLQPGERVDALVEMNTPGVWILGEPADAFRNAGLGVVVEYASRNGAPQWLAPSATAWDYRLFADQSPPPRAGEQHVERILLTIRSVFRGHGDFEHWSINGKQYPKTDLVPLTSGARYRLALENTSTEDHPIHLHRHTFELTNYAGVPTSGVRKDVVTLPAHGTCEVDFTAAAPGKALFHCHLQDHMDAGFMMLFDCR
ncbi:MAG: multicopper oxidase family protein [Gemmatimonadaceae bacterium]